MNEVKYKKWIEIKGKGLARFLILYGIIVGGAAFFIFSHLLLDSDRSAFLSASIETKALDLTSSIFFGLIIASASWYKSVKAEKKFAKLNAST
ncbi:hypothetical protein L4C37_21380 [Vibrio kagoshimensis]|uniref:hypothetical protein n=1 Tax=Vibrio kagoshimensis TaxID=2910244 RepID=UPI003D199B0E